MVLKNWSKGTSKKKYRVELWSHGKNSKKLKTIQFGAVGYGQYKDTTPLKLYSDDDTLDKKKRTSYFARHKKNYPRYSADWLSKKYLWPK